MSDDTWLCLGTLGLAAAIGFVTSICMTAAARPKKVVLPRRIVAVATLLPTAILLLGFGFAKPMPQTAAAHQLALAGRIQPIGNAAAGTACLVILALQLVAMTFVGINFARHARGPGPMAAAGAVSGCVLLSFMGLLATLAAGQLLAGASL